MKIQPINKFSVDYKRYIGAAVLFLLLVLVLVKCAGPVEPSEKPDGTEPTTQNESENSEDSQELPVLSGKVEKTKDEEVAALIAKVYRAYVGNDVRALEESYSVLSANEKSYIEVFSDYKEEYRNVECYALKLNENEYFVSPCYELKFYNVDTAAPGMDFFYLQRDDEGRLYVNSAYTTYNFNFMEQDLDAGVYSKILAYDKSEVVAALQQDVQSRYEAAVAGDEKLANLIGGTLRAVMTNWQNSISAGPSTEPDEDDTQGTEDTQGSDEPQGGDDPQGGDEPQGDDDPQGGDEPQGGDNPQGGEQTDPPVQNTTYRVRTVTNSRIRRSANVNSEQLGRAATGETFTAVGTEGEWTKIEFGGGIGYIRSDLIEKID